MNHDFEESDNDRLPPLRWSWWDLAGLACYTAGTMLDQLDNGLRMIAGRLGAHASWERDRKDAAEAQWAEDVARADMAGTLEGMVYFDGDEPVEGP